MVSGTTRELGLPVTPAALLAETYSHRECMEETHEYANELGKRWEKSEKNTKILYKSRAF